jgi:hypothetical protein
MEIRILREDEYGLLENIPDEERANVSPENTIVAAVLDDGKIKGRLVLINLPHIEAAWISPEIRNGIALAKMESLLIEQLKKLGAKLVLGFAINKKMESYFKRRGYSIVATAWKKEL